MKKLKLDLDALEVDTFDPAVADEGEGTVFGEQFGLTGWFSCGAATCLTCVASCRPTCGASCFATCHVSCFRTCGPTCYATCNLTCRLTCDATCVTCHTCIPALCGVETRICP